MATPKRPTTKAGLVEEVERLREQLAAARDFEAYRDEARLQHDQLLEIQRSLEESRDRFADLYDFAPVGYVTLNPYGVIEEINLTGSAMVGLCGPS